MKNTHLVYTHRFAPNRLCRLCRKW